MTEMENSDRLYDLAVIGLAGRFPGATDIEQFWENLCNGIESITTFSEQELLEAGVDPELLNHPSYVKAKAILSDIDQFDAGAFGLTPREAEMMDPQQRLFLQCAWHALENAGCDPTRYDGRIGMYAGMAISTYLLNNLQSNQDHLQAVGAFQMLIGNDKDFLATQASYKLNLRGPSITVQTACSTSLVAVHLACQGLLNRECDMALAGGVTVRVPQVAGYLYEPAGIASPDGRCRPFDAKAQGTVGGSGVGLAVLKRFADALEDGDTIHAVIKASAINNDGAAKIGYTAPSEDGQVEVISEALAVADVPPETITYVEAHGTGTSLGDPIEVAALTRVFRASTAAKGFCALGSVKSNFGHLDSAAGIAGLIKTILALKHKQLPPSLNFTEPNPKIDFANSPFYVNTKLGDWKTDGQPRRAGVSSFGIGGTNAHVVLEEAPSLSPTDPGRAEHLLVLSAKTAEALDRATANLAAHLRKHPTLNLADVAYTLHMGRTPFPHRRTVVCAGLADAAAALETLDPQRVLTSFEKPRHRPLFFMFPGQGAQYVNMGRGLYEQEPSFRTTVDECLALLQPHLGFSLLDVLYPEPGREAAAVERINQTAITQPAMFVIEYALACLWQTWGLRPEAMIGHSLGEYVAACLAGVFTLEAALGLVAKRGQLIQQLPGGSMLGILLPEAKVREMLNEQVSLAGINGPELCTVSGPDQAIDALQAQLEAQDINYRRLHTSHAFHSAMMDPILHEFATWVERATPQPPTLPFVSNVTGQWITVEEATDAGYWTKHLRHAVRFADGLKLLLAEMDPVLLEVGPGRTLSTFAKQQQASAAFTSLRHPHAKEQDRSFLLAALGRLWLSGLEVDWHGLYGDERRQRIPLPTYSFAQERYWIEPQARSQRHSLARPLSKGPNVADWFYAPYWKPSTVPAPQDEPTVWLILGDSAGLGPALATRLRTAGHTTHTVQAGATFDASTAPTYTLEPQRGEDYDKLLTVLDPAPQRIVYCTSKTFDFYGLVSLAQAIGRSRLPDVQIDIMTHAAQSVTGSDAIDPTQALVLGLALVIPQEYPGQACRSIDVVIPPSAWQATQLYDSLLAELAANPPEPVIAYRGTQRWVQAFEALQPPASAPSRLRTGGVYLITGGLGQIGRTLSRYLVETMQAKLVLTSRSGLPPRTGWADWLETHDKADPTSSRIRFVQALEEQGAEMLIVKADVADHDQMQGAIAQTLQQFGVLHGVLHAAGIVGDDTLLPVQDMTPATCKVQLHPKVQGAEVLAEVLHDREIDFCLLFSSLAAWLGGLGLATYAAANRFLSAFAQQQNQRQPTHWLSVSWESWRFAPWQLADEAKDSGLGASIVELAMTPDEGVQAFEQVLTLGRMPQIVISTGDLQTRLNRWTMQRLAAVEAEQPAALAEQHARPELQTPYMAPRNDIEEQLVSAWQMMLGIAPIGVHDSFFELGGHSLLATQLMSRVRDTFGIELSMRRFFKTPTIAELALGIAEAQLGDAVDEAELAALLEKVENLSDEELQHLLAEEEI